MVKKPPKNSFYFFMLDYKREEESKGRRFYNGMPQVAEEAGPAWKLVSPQEKARYERMAKESKNQRKNDPGQKYTSYGETFSEIERKKEAEERSKQEKRRAIEKTVQYLKPDSTLRTKTFFLAHVNYFFVNAKTGFHLPAELAMAEFNLEQGIINSLCIFIDPDKESFPLGYAGEAKIHREKTHRIPPNHPKLKNDYSRIYKEICTFLQRSDSAAEVGDLPPVYTLANDEGQNTSEKAVCDGLKYIYDLTHRIDGDEDAWMDVFKVYDLSKLFFELKSKTGDYASSMGLNPEGLKGAFPQQSLAESELRRDVFNYTPGIACEFHDADDNMANCSLSFVRRWVYLICDYCCQDLNIQLIPSAHIPVKADTMRPSRIASAVSSRLTSRAPSRAAGAASANGSYYGDDDDRSVVSGTSYQSLDYNAVKSLNNAEQGPRRPKVTTESTPAVSQPMRQPKPTSIGRGASIWGSGARSLIEGKPGRTRTESETSVQSTANQSAKSFDATVKAKRVDEREINVVGKSLTALGIKPIDPSVYGIEILQGADDFAKAKAEAERKAALEAAQAKPIFTDDSFPSLRGIGRGKRQVSSRGK